MIYQPVYETQGLPDTVYEIRAAEDVVTPDGTLRYSKGELVDTVTTDEMGFAESKELYLGKYEVKEVKAGYGMVLSDEVHTVELIYAGQNVAVTETASSFVNERQKVEVSFEKHWKQTSCLVSAIMAKSKISALACLPMRNSYPQVVLPSRKTV